MDEAKTIRLCLKHLDPTGVPMLPQIKITVI